MPRIEKNKNRRPWVTPRTAHTGRKRTNQKFYNSTAWRKARKAFLIQNPLCVKCQETGLVIPADVVDHKVPINEGGDKLDPNNFQALCHKHHNQKSGREGAKVTNKK